MITNIFCERESVLVLIIYSLFFFVIERKRIDTYILFIELRIFSVNKFS